MNSVPKPSILQAQVVRNLYLVQVCQPYPLAPEEDSVDTAGSVCHSLLPVGRCPAHRVISGSLNLGATRTTPCHIVVQDQASGAGLLRILDRGLR